MSSIDIIEHGKFWEEFKCPVCECVFRCTPVNLPHNYWPDEHMDCLHTYCPECDTEFSKDVSIVKMVDLKLMLKANDKRREERSKNRHGYY